MNDRKIVEALEQKALPNARVHAEHFAAQDAKTRDRFLNNLAPAAMQQLRNDIHLVMTHDKKNYSHLIKQIDQKSIEAARLAVQANEAVEKFRQEREAAKAAQTPESKQTKADYSAFMVMKDDAGLQKKNDNMDKLMEGLTKDPDRFNRLVSEIERRNPDAKKAESIIGSLNEVKDKFMGSGKDKLQSSEDLERSLTKSGMSNSG